MIPTIEPGGVNPVHGASAAAPVQAPRRRVLVAARHLALDRTSEGLCTARLIRALVAAGHEVRCLTTEVDTAPSPDGAPSVVRVTTGGSRIRASIARTADPNRATTSAGRRLRTWTALGVTVGTGLSPRSWQEVSTWRAAIRRECRMFAPDLVVARGGGLGFETHLALAGDRRAGPWVAHFHDPYPLSAYPPSYAHRSPLISARQERGARRVLRRATAVTFPSERLAAWTERSSGVELAARRVVLPHIGGDVDYGPTDTSLVDRLCGDRAFLLVHTGTLLPQRSPLALLRAWRSLLDDGDRQASDGRLVLLGSIDRRHRTDEEFRALRADLEARGALRVEDGRTNHATAFALAGRATAAVLIEADDPESPFFPAKLADYLMADLPVLAVTPARSVARDLLGADHPLLCLPGDERSIATSLRALWSGWCDGALETFRPLDPVRAWVSPEHGVTAVRQLVEQAVGQPTGFG